MKKMMAVAVFGILLGPAASSASDVEIVGVEFASRGGSEWNVTVTLRHDDTGWDHYADAWRVVDAGGEEIGIRVLMHPHVDEQPFSRSLRGVAIADSVRTVYVEARDTVNGWSKDRVEVNLEADRGARYRVTR